MPRALPAVVATLLLLPGLLAGCSGAADGDTDEQQVVHWLDERPDVASVREQGEHVVVRLEEGRTDDEVWEFVDDFQEHVAPLHELATYRVDVDGFAAALSPVPLGNRARSEAEGDLVRALWFRADGRATAVTDGAAVSVSTLVTAPAADVAALALDLQDLGIDTDDSIRVQSPDGSMGVQWSDRLDFGVDLAALRSMVALQDRFPGIRGWITGVTGATRVGVVFSPGDLSLDRLRQESARLVPWLDRDRDALGWGTFVSSPAALREATRDPAVRAAYVALAAVPGLARARYVDVLATDLASFRAARRVLAAHPRVGLRSIAYAPAPATTLGEDRDPVFETTLDLSPERLASYETVIELPDVLEVVPHTGRLVLAAGIDDDQLRTALDVVRDLAPPESGLTVVLAAARTGLRRMVGSTELAPDGSAGERGEAARDLPRDDALLDRVEAAWARLDR